MTHSVNAIINKDGSVCLIFPEENRMVPKEGECHFELSAEDKRYLMYLLNYEPLE